MSNPMLQLLVLAAIAIFLILRLRGVLGTRDGFEQPSAPQEPAANARDYDVIDTTAEAEDSDINDHAEPGSSNARALTAMKQVEPGFQVGPFLSGAKSAYEMILIAFERGDLSEVRGFLAPPVAEALEGVIADRKARELVTEAQYLGTRETALAAAEFNPATRMAEVSVRFVGEMIVATRDAAGNVVDGDAKSSRKQRDTWTFARQMGSSDPNWQLVATA
ncbi:MAG: Tim44/TimA family putative adaptor protein [Paracoccus sp. (in: a-proteobacteria)]|uniref:Tim44/TimA family putative adaptor protein n=1 Tax=Paracoccus sp. TaxID=267 RepID=UPI0039E3C1D8